MKVVFLTKFMLKGYGVSEVISNLSKALSNIGWECVVITSENDGSFLVPIKVVSPNLDSVKSRLIKEKPDLICAHTSPYFEFLPNLNSIAKTIIYEHGDPTPELFEHDKDERKEIADNKKLLYQNVDAVIAISDFIKDEILVSEAKVIYNGCNHIADLGLKDFSTFASARPLKVGFLSRLGTEENRYKNLDLSLEIAKLKNVEISIMGRGDKKAAARYEQAGIIVHLNASNSERLDYLRELDVLISPSFWEGFNLPLVEAQSVGTIAIGFDVGAHPEVTPFIATDIEDLLRKIGVLAGNRNLLKKLSDISYKFVRNKFSWEKAAYEFSVLAVGLENVKRPDYAVVKGLKAKPFIKRLKLLYRNNGYVRGTAIIGKKILRRMILFR